MLYSELDAAGKKAAAENVQQYLANADIEGSWITDALNQQIEEAGFTDLTVDAWSLSCCQGDGVSVKGSISLQDAEALPAPVTRLLQALTVRDVDYTVTVSGSWRSCCTSVAVDCHHSLTSLEGRALDDLEYRIKRVVEDLCKQLEHTGYALIEAESDDEAVQQFIENTDPQFDEWGNLED